MRHTSDAKALLWRTVLKCRRPKLRAQIRRLPSRSCGRHPALTLSTIHDASETIRKNERSVMATPTFTRSESALTVVKQCNKLGVAFKLLRR